MRFVFDLIDCTAQTDGLTDGQLMFRSSTGLIIKPEVARESAYLRQVFLQVGTLRTSNLNSVALTVLQLLAINVQKFRGSLTLNTPIFENF